jgi:hypothetical protein
MPAGSAIRKSLRSTLAGSGRSPRRGSPAGPAPGPAGTLFWEDVLPGEVGAGPFEDLHFYLQNPLLPAQPDQLGSLVAGQALPVALLDIGLVSPSATTARLHHIGLSKHLRGTHVIVLIDDRDIRVLDRNTGHLIHKLVLDPTRDYQPRGVKCGNSLENRLEV